MNDPIYGPVFDEGFYRDTHGLGPKGTLDHFISHGDSAGLDPSPYFSTSYYRNRYPDWQAGGARTSVEDFMRRLDAGEVRQPHPLIDPIYYAQRYTDLAQLGHRAVLHFARSGDYEVRSPSARFDADFYQRCYLAPGQDRPFRHFITSGRQAGNQPRFHTRPYEETRTLALSLARQLRHPLLLCAHDAQPAGVPLLTLDLGIAAAARGWQPVFILMRGGPLIDRFRAIGTVVLMAEGWDLPGLVAGLPARTPVLINTSAAAELAVDFAKADHPCMILLHEMGDYIRDQNFIPALRAAQAEGVEIIASMPRVADGLKNDLGALPLLRPGIMLPHAPIDAFRRIRAFFSAQRGPAFIGAGHADYRKGFDLFLEAAKQITSRRPNAHFVWLGALDRWAQDLADQAVTDGLDLILPGFVDISLAWYRAADVYLLTSRQDPGPTTLVHAAAVGTPFVGYRHDIGLIDQAAALGRFVEPGDTAGFVDAALTSVETVTPQSRRQMRRYVKRETKFSVYLDALLEKLNPPPASG